MNKCEKTDGRKEEEGEQSPLCYDKLRKYSESKGLRLILEIIHQLGCLFVGGDKVFVLYINKGTDAARSLCHKSQIH